MRNQIFTLSRDQFLLESAKFEAEGAILSNIIINEQSKILNDCEKAYIDSVSLDNDYSDKFLKKIKSLIRQNGELDNYANLLASGWVTSSSKNMLKRILRLMAKSYCL